MPRLSFVAALACATILAAIPNSPAFAAATTTTVVVPHVTATPTTGTRLSPNTTTGQTIHQGPKQRRWVCGPIVNWDGSPHCHWVD